MINGVSIFTGYDDFDSGIATYNISDKQTRFGQQGSSYLSEVIISKVHNLLNQSFTRLDLAFSFPNQKVKTQAFVMRGSSIEPFGSSKYNRKTYDDLENEFSLTNAEHNFDDYADFEIQILTVSKIEANSFNILAWTGATTRITL